MQFEFQNPTHLIFGAGVLSRLGEIAGGFGKRALLVTGGGSVKRTGVFDRATAGRFLDAILSRGGSRDALEDFIEFRGRKPDITPLLRQHGIAA